MFNGGIPQCHPSIIDERFQTDWLIDRLIELSRKKVTMYNLDVDLFTPSHDPRRLHSIIYRPLSYRLCISASSSDVNVTHDISNDVSRQGSHVTFLR